MSEILRFATSKTHELLREHGIWYVLCAGDKVRELNEFEVAHVEAAWHAGRRAAEALTVTEAALREARRW